MAKRAKKKTEEQMSMFAIGGLEEGGLRDQGGSIDPVSGNDVPSGSTQSEVRDDIPAQLSEGEFVLPADVVRYIGLENLMELRNKAKQGLQQMEDMGQMGNSDEATMSDTASMEVDIDSMIDAFDPNDPATMEFNVGGAVGTLPNPLMGPAPPVSPPTPIYKQPTVPTFASFVRNPAQMAAQQLQPVKENREYIGPNGERISITFVNGSPSTPVPEGYKPYDAEAEAKKAPKIVAPTVSEPVQGDSRDDTEKEKEDADRIKAYNEVVSKLAETNPEIKKLQDAAGAAGNIPAVIMTTMQLQAGVSAAQAKTAAGLNMNIDGLSVVDAQDKIEIGRTDDQTKRINDLYDLVDTEYETGDGDGDGSIGRKSTSIPGYDVDEAADAIDRGQNFPPNPESGPQRENTPANAASDPSYNDLNTFKKGGLASPKVKTKRKPKMKRGGLASKK